MHFTQSLIGLVASALVVNAGRVTFEPQDSTSRTVVFTPAPGSSEIADITVAGSDQTVHFPKGWGGNFYAYAEGEDASPGMLGEVIFNGWNGLTYFDVSSIVNPDDKTNVKEMWPAKSKSPTSGCASFPCDNAYVNSDDVQTKSTKEHHLITTLGG